MKKLLLVGAFFILAMMFWSIACTGKKNPTGPHGSQATLTFTPTITPTGTISPTATPYCSGVPDVTSYIDGADYLSSDVGKTIPTLFNLDHGGTTTGDVLTFTLASPATLNISLCPTEQVGRKMVLYVRSVCTSVAGEFYNTGFCDGLPEANGISLAAGSYYILLAENTGSIAGSGGVYTMRLKSGSDSSVVCNPSNGVVPEAVPKGVFGSCFNFYQMNGDPPNGSYGAPFSGSRAVTGYLDESAATANSDDFLSFIPANDGAVTVTMDCFDNGLGANDFDIYGATTCPTDKTTPPYVGYSESTSPQEQFSFTGTGGTTYYLDVRAYQGLGHYRVTVQTP